MEPLQGQLSRKARKNDAVLSVSQDNDAKRILIREANDVFYKTTEYTSTDIIGKELTEILNSRISQSIEDYVEFEPSGTDLSDVLSRIRDFSVVCRGGKEIKFLIKINRGEPYGRSDRFDLYMRDISLQMEFEEHRNRLIENMKGFEVVDESTGLPNRSSLLKELEMVSYYVSNRNVIATFAIVELQDINTLKETIGLQQITKITRITGETIRKTLREDDAIGILSEGRIGIILLDADSHNSALILARLRRIIVSELTEQKVESYENPAICIGYVKMTSSSLESTIKAAEAALAQSARSENNTPMEYRG